MFGAWALHPTRVVHPGPRRALPARSGERIPTRVEEDKQRFDAVARRDADKLRETALEAPLILGPELIVEEDPHSVEPVEPRPSRARYRCAEGRRCRPETSQAG